MPVRSEVLASQVASHAGVSTPLAAYALRAVIAGLGAYLSPASRQLVAEELPQALAAALVSSPGDRRPLEDRVQLTGMTASQTRELIASVCRVLADRLSREANDALIAALPPAVGAMLVGSSPSVPHSSPRHRQGGSIAEPNPHAQTKLSSAPGTTQEIKHETLAEWRGRSRRRVSEPN